MLSCPTFPPRFEGLIFDISHDSVTKDRETAKEHEAHLAKNADRQRHQDEEAAQGADEDGLGPPAINVYQTPSTNLAIAFNELDKLPHILEVEKVRAHIIAAQVQVNEFWNDAPSYSNKSAHNHQEP